MSLAAVQLNQYLTDMLGSHGLKDYCANGWQVQGRAQISKLVTGVTASQTFLQQAIAAGADAVLVHHGWFWQGEDPRVLGVKYQRLSQVIKSDLNLFAYHLPLDLHPEFGNNVCLGRLLAVQNLRTLSGKALTATNPELVLRAELPQAITLAELQGRLASLLDFDPLLIGDPERQVRRISWCTGAAMREFQSMVAAGMASDIDVFISGEISEPCTHLALESGIAYLAAGHHATERLGVQAIGEHLAQTFGVQHQFIDCPVPV